MPEFEFTTEQRQAIETVDRSVLVTAAAGSGKTAVLSARCAYLICDAPPQQRCGVDQLLVVTFTEAAAAEMRSRIHEAVRERLAHKPYDGYLRTQLALINTAQISTIHAFCLWTIRRWFNLADVDPSARVLDEDETRLLRTETIDALFRELYESQQPLGDGFRALVDAYGLGRDGQIATLVLHLDDLADSLCDPDAWLDEAVDRVADQAEQTIRTFRAHLDCELAIQQAECESLAPSIVEAFPAGAFYGRRVEEYARQLAQWRGRLGDGSFDSIQDEICNYAFDLKGAPRLGKNAPAEAREQRDQAKSLFDYVREKLCQRRLQKRFGQFTEAELSEGLQAVAPYVTTIAGLVREFGKRYTAAKRTVPALDFADLERVAYRLLTRPEGDVAGILRDKFAHVLVDEFQDVNPVQDAILRQVSREYDPNRSDNLFAVGDVKQSIYRFRLAEPSLLRRREDAFDAGESGGLCVRLQRNYRSRETLIDAVNLMFRPLMRPEVGEIDYDDRSALRFARRDCDPQADHPIAVHLLSKRIETPDEADETRDYVDFTDPAQWTPIEREAYLIGTRIREMVTGAPLTDPQPSRDRQRDPSCNPNRDRKGAVSGGEAARQEADDPPPRYGDIAILLRAASHSAGPIADLLSRMGIPAYADARGALFEALEVQDVLSLLQVLDNRQQDIPLAAVLRSRVLGERLSEDDLVSIRGIDRTVPFHRAVNVYAERGADSELRRRVARRLQRIERYRADFRQRPLADALWAVYQETGYLAYVGGLPGGAQRRANLRELHERARQFGTFQRQGLYRFLRFIDLLKDEQRDLRTAPGVMEGQDVVRIMTIHRSKGLEFPVVFVAGLGRRFNLQDAAGRMIFDRDAGIGLKVVDRDRMIDYPSAAHHLVSEQIESVSRAEELRILYVALTRAKERLVLVGSTDLSSVEQARQRWGPSKGAITPLTVLSATTPLEWMIPVLAAATSRDVEWPGDSTGRRAAGPKYRVHLHTQEQMAGWRLDEADASSEEPIIRAVAQLDPLPDTEPLGNFAVQADEVVARLDFAYPHLAASSVRAVMAASELKRPFDALADPDEQPRDRVQAVSSFELLAEPMKSGGAVVSARRRGTATHTLLQRMRLDAADDPERVRAELRRLVDEGWLAAEDADAVDVESIVWFAGTPVGRRVRQAGDAFRREVMFLSTEPAETFDRTLPEPGDGPVVVRGIVDGLLLCDDALELIEYKTDRISPDEADARAKQYALQVRLYTRAMARSWRRPVRRSWLVFLHPRSLVELEPDG